jgi:multicomponent Na+:H+ antiporter subunit D
VILALPLAVPWVMAAVLALLDGRRRVVGWLAVAVLAAAVALLARLGLAVLAGGPVEMTAGGWPPGVGITLRADALGLAFAVLSVGVLLVALVYEVLLGVHERTLPALVVFLATGLTGLFLTADVFNFYVFFEISMAASFVLACYGRRQPEIRAALIFTVVNLLGSVIFLTAVAGLYHLTGTLDMAAIGAGAAGARGERLLVAVLVFAAFSLKLGLFPFHFWLPPIYRDAWPAVAAILAGAVANIGSYGLIRFGAGILEAERALAAPALLALGAVSVVYGATQAVSVRSASEALAYSAVGQAGYILLALGLGSPVGLAAAVLYALVNAANKAVLFLAAGLTGPLVAGAFLIGALSVTGIPPSAGFLGKLALFRATIDAESAGLTGLVVLGGALSFLYMFQIYQRSFRAGTVSAPPSPRGARVLVLALASGILAAGAWPEPLLALGERAAAALAGPAGAR